MTESWQKVGLLLKEGAVLAMPTDTIYGIVGSVFNKKTIKEIYRLKKRDKSKPFIVLISSLGDLSKFNIKISPVQKKILNNIWPGKISVVLKCPSKKFFYLHRGLKSIVFRLPAGKELSKILSVSGPLVAPSANPENCPPAKSIREARKYFGDSVIYYKDKKQGNKPSTIIDLRKKPFNVLRKGGVVLHSSF